MEDLLVEEHGLALEGYSTGHILLVLAQEEPSTQKGQGLVSYRFSYLAYQEFTWKTCSHLEGIILLALTYFDWSCQRDKGHI